MGNRLQCFQQTDNANCNCKQEIHLCWVEKLMQGEIWQTTEKEGKCICGRALQVLTIPKITFYVQIFRCLSWG